MQRVAQESPQSLFASNLNSDHVIAQNVLSVLLIENFPNAGPDTSGHNPVQASITV